MALTATDISSMTRCPHRVYLDRFGNAEERVPYSEFLQVLWESGRLHEEEVTTALDVRIPEGEDFSARRDSSLELMLQGAPLIYHAAIRTNTLVGEPDLLKRVEVASKLGAHSYLPVEIKNGHVWVNASAKVPKPKPHYIAQLCAYSEILGDLQGVTPTQGYIIDSENQWVLLDLGEFWPQYEDLRDLATQLAGGAHLTIAGKKPACDQCVWIELCDADVHRRDDVTLVAGIGDSYRDKLAQVGVRSVQDLVSVEPSSLLNVKGIGQSFAEKWTRAARVMKSAKVELLAPWTPPQTSFEVSYDIEDFFFSGNVYLHGVLVRPSNALKFGNPSHQESDFGRYLPECAVAGETEESVWRRFLESVEAINALDDYVVYVYSSHERTHLARLRSRYGSSKSLDDFEQRIVDLYDVVRNNFVFPTESMGLKAIANFCGFSWRDSDPGGSQSIAWWAHYLKDPAANSHLRDRVLTYNEDDVRAAFAMRDWMERSCQS